MGAGVLSQKWSLPLSTAEAKNGWSYTSAPSVCLTSVVRDNCISYRSDKSLSLRSMIRGVGYISGHTWSDERQSERRLELKWNWENDVNNTKKKNHTHILQLNSIYFWRWIHSATNLSTQITTTCHVTTITTNVIFVLYTNFKGYYVCNWFFPVITIPESLLSTSKLCTVA